MPSKPKKPCCFPGCSRLTDGRYCEEHRKEAAKRYNRYERDPEINKRYDRRWEKIRAAYLQRNPLCEQCSKEGRVAVADMVHHIIPLSEGGTHDWTNLRALCNSCHSKLHAERGDRWGYR